MSEYKFIETLPGEKNFDLFQKLPQSLYTVDQLRYKQTESLSTDHLQTAYVLLKDNEPVGRYALYLNPQLKYHNQKSACIGSYECIEDAEPASLLIAHAKQEAQKLGAEYLIGPMDGSTWNNYRFSDHNKHPNFLLEPYCHVYYNKQFIDNGFDAIAQYESTLAPKFEVDENKMSELENSLLSKGLVFRKLNIENIDSELKKICDFSNEAFKENFLYSPVDPNVFIAKYKKFIPFLDPEYVLLAEESNGNLAGLHFCYDSRYTHQKTLVVKTLARTKNKNYSGLGNYLAGKLISTAFKNGYDSMIYALMLKENAPVMKLSDELKSVPYKAYSLYGLQL